jgi:hypothetical protein
VKAMLRIGTFLIILLTTPLVRDCCLPVTQVSPCHESKHQNDETCFANQQAIAEAKGVVAFKITLNHWLPSVFILHSRDFPIVQITAYDVARSQRVDGTDLYLRTRALLI